MLLKIVLYPWSILLKMYRKTLTNENGIFLNQSTTLLNSKT